MLQPTDKAVTNSIPYQLAKDFEREIVANLIPVSINLKQIDERKLDVMTSETDLQYYNSLEL